MEEKQDSSRAAKERLNFKKVQLITGVTGYKKIREKNRTTLDLVIWWVQRWWLCTLSCQQRGNRNLVDVRGNGSGHTWILLPLDYPLRTQEAKNQRMSQLNLSIFSIPHLEKEMATHSSILAWRIPWTEEPGGLQSTGSQRVGHDWATSLTYSLTCSAGKDADILKW